MGCSILPSLHQSTHRTSLDVAKAERQPAMRNSLKETMIPGQGFDEAHRFRSPIHPSKFMTLDTSLSKSGRPLSQGKGTCPARKGTPRLPLSLRICFWAYRSSGLSSAALSRKRASSQHRLRNSWSCVTSMMAMFARARLLTSSGDLPPCGRSRARLSARRAAGASCVPAARMPWQAFASGRRKAPCGWTSSRSERSSAARASFAWATVSPSFLPPVARRHSFKTLSLKSW